MNTLKKYSSVLLILLVAFFAFFINLGGLEADIMEARNFITAREILDSNDWLHPTMNGELRLAKPPLPTWITAISASIFGLENLFFLRLPAALMSLWMLFSMYHIVKFFSKNNQLAFFSAIALGSMLYIMLIGRRGTWDIYTHSFILAAILQFLRTITSTHSIVHGVLGGIFLGASILSKGPVAPYAVFVPFLIAYLTFYRTKLSTKTILSLIFFVGLGIFIASTWYYFAYIQFGNESVAVLNHEVNNWKNYNVKPWYYYLKDYPVHSGIWVITLTISLFSFYTFNKTEEKKLYRFFWLWTILSIILLSIIPEKKVRYLLPTFIPASFLVSSYLEYIVSRLKAQGKKIDKIIFSIHWWIFLMASLGLPLAIYMLFWSKQLIPSTVFALICVCCLLVSLIFFFAYKRKRYKWFITGVFALVAILNTFVVPYTQRVANDEFKNISQIKDIPVVLGLDCYALEETRIDLVWHIGKKIKEVKSIKELAPPYLLLTDKPPESYMPPNTYYELLGYYDNNSKPKGHRHHRNSLSKYVSVILN